MLGWEALHRTLIFRQCSSRWCDCHYSTEPIHSPWRHAEADLWHGSCVSTGYGHVGADCFVWKNSLNKHNCLRSNWNALWQLGYFYSFLNSIILSIQQIFEPWASDSGKAGWRELTDKERPPWSYLAKRRRLSKLSDANQMSSRWQWHTRIPLLRTRGWQSALPRAI